MAVAFVNSGTAASAGTATITPGNPTSLASGNLLIAVCKYASSGSTITAGSGWTNLYGHTFSFSVGSFAVFYKITTGTEGANSFTTSTSGGGFYAQIHQFSGNDTTTPIRATAGAWFNSTVGTTQDVGVMPILSNNSMAVWWVDKSGAPSAGGTGWTQTVNNTSQLYSLWTQTVSSAGFSTDLNWTYTASNPNPFIGWEIVASGQAEQSGRTSCPYIRQQGQAGAANGTSQLMNLPPNMKVGNVLLLVLIGLANANTTFTVSGGGTGGFTIPAFQQLGTGTTKLAYGWRVIDGSEGNTCTPSWSSSSSPLYMAFEIGNCSGMGNPQTTITGTGTSFTQTAWNTSKANATALSFIWCNSSTISTTGPGTLNNWMHYQTSANYAMEYQEVSGAAGTSTTSYTDSQTTSTTYAIASFELWPTISGPSLTETHYTNTNTFGTDVITDGLIESGKTNTNTFGTQVITVGSNVISLTQTHLTNTSRFGTDAFGLAGAFNQTLTAVCFHNGNILDIAKWKLQGPAVYGRNLVERQRGKRIRPTMDIQTLPISGNSVFRFY